MEEGRPKRELGYFCHFHKQQQRQQAGKQVAKGMERGSGEGYGRPVEATRKILKILENHNLIDVIGLHFAK